MLAFSFNINIHDLQLTEVICYCLWISFIHVLRSIVCSSIYLEVIHVPIFVYKASSFTYVRKINLFEFDSRKRFMISVWFCHKKRRRESFLSRLSLTIVISPVKNIITTGNNASIELHVVYYTTFLRSFNSPARITE